MHGDGVAKEPHVYTQEEAVSMRNEIYELKHEISKKENNFKNVKSKLDIALQIMSKEQLIEFIEKIV